MGDWFKIDEDNFTAIDIGIQFNIDTANNTYGYAKIIQQSSQTIDIKISVDYNKTNSDYFFNLFDKRNQSQTIGYKFNMSSSSFTANGCRIKSIITDPTTNLIVMDIISDFAKVRPVDERRDEIIDELLNETSKNKNI